MPRPLPAVLGRALAHWSPARVLQRAGSPVHVQPFAGWADGAGARVGGRVVAGAAPLPRRSQRTSTWQAVRANLAPFVAFDVPHARVRVELGGCSTEVSADGEGYVDAVLPGVRLPPGRHAATLTPLDPPGEPATAVVHVPDPAADVVVVSDIDDTIIDSGVARGVLATLTTALLRDSTTRTPLDGAPALYRALAPDPRTGAVRPFFYLSTSPWNLSAFLQGFLERHGFPGGPLVLADWGPASNGVLRAGSRTHKLSALRRVAERLPGTRLLLLGDSGQQDAAVYTAFALEAVGRVAAVYIRPAGVMTPARQQHLDECARLLAGVQVPFLVTEDSSAVLAHARAHGLAAPTA